MATVFIASGPLDGRWFPLQKKALVFGRDEALLAQVPDSGVSRKHLTIRYDPAADGYVAVDMKSKNGVFLNDQRIDGEAPLKANDLIRIGDTLLLFVPEDFQGQDNALKFYRQRGERLKVTTQLKATSVKDAMEKLRRSAADHPGA